MNAELIGFFPLRTQDLAWDKPPVIDLIAPFGRLANDSWQVTHILNLFQSQTITVKRINKSQVSEYDATFSI